MYEPAKIWRVASDVDWGRLAPKPSPYIHHFTYSCEELYSDTDINVFIELATKSILDTVERCLYSFFCAGADRCTFFKKKV